LLQEVVDHLKQENNFLQQLPSGSCCKRTKVVDHLKQENNLCNNCRQAVVAQIIFLCAPPQAGIHLD